MKLVDTEEALGRLDGDREIYLDLVNTFLDLTPADFFSFRSLLAEGNEAELAHRVHQLKGGALTLGCTALASPAATLEALIRNAQPGDRTALIAEMERVYHETIAELKSVRASLQKPN